VRNGVLCFFAVLMVLSRSPVRAADLPLWEAGFGLAGLTIPDYRGSSRQQSYLLPLPYLIYRGEILRIDRKGMYGLLAHSDRIELNVSGDAGVPVDSSRNSARQGMEDLDPTVQFGPQLEICVVNACNADFVVQVRLPVRAVVAVNSSRVYGVGFVLNPQINVDLREIGGRGGWNAGAAIGPIFASKQYHSYYYGVQPQDARPGRPAYEAREGYSGLEFVTSVSRRFDHTWFGSFLRYYMLESSVIEKSPLIKSRNSFMTGIGLAWIFDESTTLVRASQ